MTRYIFFAKSGNGFIIAKMNVVKADKDSLEDCIGLARKTFNEELAKKDYEIVGFQRKEIK